MAFEALTEKFSRIFKSLRGQSRLTEANMDEMLREIRVALLEADVNFKVVKEFINNVKEKSIGQEVYTKVNPSQMITKIVHDELETLLGSTDSELIYQKNRPTVIMLVGLQGSGKTTAAGKLALMMKKKLNKKVLLAACDIYRPAAIDQLKKLGSDVGVPVYSTDSKDAVQIAVEAKEMAFNDHYDVLIIDTAGRLQIDEQLMDELNNIQSKVAPDEILLLVDAMAGQDAVNVANGFKEKIELTGLIMSKLDGDSRGGAALSVKHLTGLPIKFASVGEKLTDLDAFHPDRMADRILGMGDVVTLVEKVQEEIDEKQAKKMVSKMANGKFTLDDMIDQLRQIKKLGSLGGLLKLIPGMPKISGDQIATVEKEMKLYETICNSMTYEERIHPEILKNSRKVRIANGSGTTNADINRMLKRYEASCEMMKKMKNGNNPFGGGMGGLGGMNFPGM